eukprot:c25331_g3_i1 orf=230-1234(-)
MMAGKNIGIVWLVVMSMGLLQVYYWKGAECSELALGFYDKTCPRLEHIVYRGMRRAVHKEARLAASILRLLFHDCFVQGCDASLLLDDTPTFQGEKMAGPNNKSVRGFEVIDDIKKHVEKACPGVVSCADILALASRDGVSLLKGPKWDVPLGRRDSKTASLSEANTQIPPPNSTLSTLISKFSAQGLSTLDMVVLSGAHTIGFARCVQFKQRLYNAAGSGQQDPTLKASFATKLTNVCPRMGGDNNLAPLDLFSPTLFNSQYYINLLMGEGLLASDQILASPSSSTASLTHSFANSQSDFFENFKKSMVKLSSINVLTGSNGEIRKNCRKINS